MDESSQRRLLPSTVLEKIQFFLQEPAIISTSSLKVNSDKRATTTDDSASYTHNPYNNNNNNNKSTTTIIEGNNNVAATPITNNKAATTTSCHTLQLPPWVSQQLQCPPFLHIQDHALENYESLKKEILSNKIIISRLKPAKVNHEVQFDTLMNIVTLYGNNNQTVTLHRGDHSAFLTKEDKKLPYLGGYIRSIESEVSRLFANGNNDSLIESLDLSRTSVQLSRFQGNGSGYPRHCDVAPQCGVRNQKQINVSNQGTIDHTSSAFHRVVTAVLYLTQSDWNDANDGGQLRVYIKDTFNKNDLGNNKKETSYDISPLSNRVVLFRSDIVEHEVMPCLRRDRWALTVWVYGRLINKLPQLITTSSHSSNAPYASSDDNFIPQPLKIREVVDSKNIINDGTIFVAIPSFRDSELLPTLLDVYYKASNPNRVFVGVVEQIKLGSSNNEGVETNLIPDVKWVQNNLRIITVDCKISTGPCWARAMCQSLLWRGEDFLLSIDSHMRFRQNYDSYLIQQLYFCSNPSKSIITNYPIGYTLPNNIPSITNSTLLIPWKFDDNGLLRQKGKLLQKGIINNVPSRLWAAGFNFAFSSVINDVPYDPHLPQLFFGEELSMALRLFTYGYDFFSPPETVCYHLWARDHRETFQESILNAKEEEKRKMDKQLSIQKIKKLLNGESTSGIGDERSVQDFCEHIGVDFQSRQVKISVTTAEEELILDDRIDYDRFLDVVVAGMF